jgi:thioredoxin 1
MKPIDLHEADFQRLVLDCSQPVLVGFWTSSDDSSRQMALLLDDIAIQYKGRLRVVRVDVNQNPGVAKYYHVYSVPILLFFLHGLIHDQIIGPLDEISIQSKLKDFLK